MKNPSQINQNGAQERFGGALGCKSALGNQEVPTPGARAQLFGTTWAILVAIWDPPGAQRGYQNLAFLHQVVQKS